MSANPRRFPLFRQSRRTAVYPAGAIICEEGGAGRTMYAIKRGTVAVIVGGNTVATLGEEEIFGEMALLDHAPRTATVKTLEETELVEIDEAEFLALVRENPDFAIQMMRL